MDTFHAVVLLLHLLLMPIARFVKNKAGNSLSFFSFRSSICSFFSKIVLLKIFEKFRGECLCSPTHLFRLNFGKFLRKSFLQDISALDKCFYSLVIDRAILIITIIMKNTSLLHLPCFTFSSPHVVTQILLN